MRKRVNVRALHLQQCRDIKLNGKTLENRTIVTEHKTSTRNKET